jgi:hypothetical protein
MSTSHSTYETRNISIILVIKSAWNWPLWTYKNMYSNEIMTHKNKI